MQVTVRPPQARQCYVTFLSSAYGHLFLGCISKIRFANTAIGAVMGEYSAGGRQRKLVGATGGQIYIGHSMGGMVASCMISTIVEGLLGGLNFTAFSRRGRPDRYCLARLAGAVRVVVELGADADYFIDSGPFGNCSASWSISCRDDGERIPLAPRCSMRICSISAPCSKNTSGIFCYHALKVAASTEDSASGI